MIIYYFNGQTLHDQKLKIPWNLTASLACTREENTGTGQKGGCSSEARSCQRHLHASLRGLYRSRADSLTFFVFPFDFFFPPVM